MTAKRLQKCIIGSVLLFDLVGKDFLIISSESQALFEKEGNVLGF